MYLSAEFRIYGRLFTKALPEEQDPNDPESTWRNNINPKSLQVRLYEYRVLIIIPVSGLWSLNRIPVVTG